MGRHKTTVTYTEAAKQVLQELGGGPIRSGDLIAAILERGLVPNTKYLYNHVLRAVRESAEFDTSTRGYVALANTAAPATAAVAS